MYLISQKVKNAAEHQYFYFYVYLFLLKYMTFFIFYKSVIEEK